MTIYEDLIKELGGDVDDSVLIIKVINTESLKKTLYYLHEYKNKLLESLLKNAPENQKNLQGRSWDDYAEGYNKAIRDYKNIIQSKIK